MRFVTESSSDVRSGPTSSAMVAGANRKLPIASINTAICVRQSGSEASAVDSASDRLSDTPALSTLSNEKRIALAFEASAGSAS